MAGPKTAASQHLQREVERDGRFRPAPIRGSRLIRAQPLECSMCQAILCSSVGFFGILLVPCHALLILFIAKEGKRLSQARIGNQQADDWRADEDGSDQDFEWKRCRSTLSAPLSKQEYDSNADTKKRYCSPLHPCAHTALLMCACLGWFNIERNER